MSNTTNITMYKHQAYLELCLMLIEEAYRECEHENYELVSTQLRDILDTFRDKNFDSDTPQALNNVLTFPRSH